MRLEWDSDFWGIEYGHVLDPTEDTSMYDFTQLIADSGNPGKEHSSTEIIPEMRIQNQKSGTVVS